MKNKIKALFIRITGEIKYLKIGVKCNYSWYGNGYGGFYVHPDLLNKDSIIYSFGIGTDISFDKEISEKHHCKVFGFDPTPKSINWIKNQDLPNGFNFYDYGISDKSGFVDFFLPQNNTHVSGSVIIQNNVNSKKKVKVEMKSLVDIMNSLGHKHIDVLKMDIEGSEYSVLENILNSEIDITQFLIEFHGRLIENGKLKTKRIIKKLSNAGYEIFGISDSFEEISFVKQSKLIEF